MDQNLEGYFELEATNAGYTYDGFFTRIQTTANGARLDVVSSLEKAMQELVGVVTEIHASYDADEEVNASRSKMLGDMRASFEQVEQKAGSRHQEFAKVHEEIVSFDCEIIGPLKTELRDYIEEANHRRKQAQQTADKAHVDYRAATSRRNEAQADVDKWQGIVDNPILNGAATVLNYTPFGFLATQITRLVAPGEPANAKEALDDCRSRLDRQRVAIEESQRTMNEAEASSRSCKDIADRCSSILSKLAPLLVATEGLADKSNKFKALLIQIKGSATNLVKEATEVAASTEVTSDNSYTKSDFAQGILNICQEALFDVLVQDEVETVLQELANAWTVDGQLSMPTRVKKRYDQVHEIVKSYKQDGKTAAWDALIEELSDCRWEATDFDDEEDQDVDIEPED